MLSTTKVLHHVNGVNTLRVYDKSARGTSLGEIRCQPAAADRRAVGRPRTATVLSSAAMRGLLTHSHSGLRPWASREGIREGMLTVANVLSLCASWSCHTRRRRAPTPPLSDSWRGAAPRAREYDLTRHTREIETLMSSLVIYLSSRRSAHGVPGPAPSPSPHSSWLS